MILFGLYWENKIEDFLYWENKNLGFSLFTFVLWDPFLQAHKVSCYLLVAFFFLIFFFSIFIVGLQVLPPLKRSSIANTSTHKIR